MKKIFTFFVLLLISVISFAQNPKLSYQAVVRDSQNKLVVEQPVTVTVNVLKADNAAQFSQTLNANTNRNGLMSLEIGDETAAWSNIDWTGAKIRTAITLPNGSQVVDTSNVNAVPFALYANSVPDEVLDNLKEAQASQMDTLKQNLDSLSNLFFDHAYLDGKPCPLTNTISDGTNSYPTVVIGKQCWMAKNLRTTAGLDYRDDYFHVNNNENNDEEYGLLYTWYAATDNQTQDGEHPMVKGICPEGWHIPSIAEWNTMTSYISSRPTQFRHCGNGNIASTLASKTQWSGSSDVDCSPAKDLSANNITGFNILPAGIYYNYASGYGTSSYFWSSSELAYNYAYHIRFFNNNAIVINDNFDMNGAFSVRCLRNTAVVSSSESESQTISCDDVKACIADNLSQYTKTTELCNVVNNCDLSSNASIANLSTLLQGLSDQMETMNGKLDSLNHLVDTLDKLNAKINNLTVVVEEQNAIIDSLYHIMDSLVNPASDTIPTPEDIDGQPCLEAPTVSDGTNTYKTVKLGTQCWMAENMRRAKKTNGEEFPYGEHYCPGKLTTAYCDSVNTYGYLYTWNAANEKNSYSPPTSNVRGICPEGWHIPTDDEWETLISYVKSVSEYKCGGNANYIGKALASKTGWNSDGAYEDCLVAKNQADNNVTGFNAYPAGSYESGFSDMGTYANFWSANFNAYQLYGGRKTFKKWDSVSSEASLSVRCLKD